MQLLLVEKSRHASTLLRCVHNQHGRADFSHVPVIGLNFSGFTVDPISREDRVMNRRRDAPGGPGTGCLWRIDNNVAGEVSMK